ncbi:Arf-GAP with Rho-GAP domain, ANK repeat and PH domain-containing protein 1 [Operophtera brumata]|uniref:Arf-GAP with Rho-GAP domain, ANK repeat and PH domain-containing protein 1 n=1 Tax=Operophtera brumata TaxID=104452 RepID=A0A0L7K3X9_OPEBR|nr:Arf-GAP with Rho-GAP domain, ANK repeat and PH domain-containing protein 1 [Operophtera brumata]
MDTPPVPKPRSVAPTPLPRHLGPANEKVDTAHAADIFSTLGTKSKQFTEGVATKISNSAKGTLEKTKSTSRAVRDSVTKSVIEGTTAGLKLLKPRKIETSSTTTQTQRCASMPDADVNFFENISFISPLQKRYASECKQSGHAEPVCFHLNHTNFDDLSLFSGTSDTYTDSISDSDLSAMMGSGIDQMTYDTPRCSRANSVTSSNSIPEIPERKKKLEINEKKRLNTSYENYQLPTVLSVPGAAPKKVLPEVKPRPSQSTIYEFDPLNTSTSSPKYKGISNELLLLESFLIGDTYGTVVAVDNDEDILEYVENDYFNPPSPPERFDSLAELDRQGTAAAVVNESHSNWYVTEGNTHMTTEVPVKRSDSMIQKFSRRLKLDNVLHKPVKLNEPEVLIVERPPINHLPASYFSGNIMRTVAPGLVEELFKTSQSRYCVLSDQKLVCYSDPTNAIVKEIHLLNSIYCVQLHIASGPRMPPRKHVFSCSSVSERRNWVQKISEHLAAGFPPKYNAEYNRMGWKRVLDWSLLHRVWGTLESEGVTGEWRGAWLMLVRRVLLYYTAGREQALVTIDLRKTKCVALIHVTIQCKHFAEARNETKMCAMECNCTKRDNWRYMIKLAAQTNGAYIHHQQLTKDDVPAIVEKCISFVYAYGM